MSEPRLCLRQRPLPAIHGTRMDPVWRPSGLPAERGRWEEKTWTASGRVPQLVGVRGRAGRVLGVATPSFILELRSLIGTRPLWLSVAVALVVDGENRILLGRRADSGAWALPGGIIEPGEEPADAAARECFEETGVVVVPEAVTALTVSPARRTRTATRFNAWRSRSAAARWAARPASTTTSRWKSHGSRSSHCPN